MNITNDSTGSPDYIGYFTKQFLIDLGKMAELRDELAKRQGALSAVEATIKAKSTADAYALSKKVDADAILEKAKEAKATAEALVAELKNNGAELEARIAVNDAELAQRSPAKAEWLQHQDGYGRDLFALFRRHASLAEEGASPLL
jgi:hypothetical protein